MITMEKDNVSCQKKLGQILVEEGRIENSKKHYVHKMKARSISFLV